MPLATWLAFLAASWAISVSPGAGAVAAMSAGLNHGFARGYMLTFGLILGFWTQLVAIGLGLGALIAASALAFGIVKWLGVAYLLWLGIRQWLAPAEPLMASGDNIASRRSLVLRGWMVNAVNPKGTIFFLAVVPQFLDLSHALLPQYAVIGATLALTDLVVMAGYTSLAARMLRLFRTRRRMRILNRIFGSLFVALSVLLAMFRRG